MSDPRLIPVNDRVAAAHLRGQVRGRDLVEGAARLLSVPVADLRHAPHGRRERQLLLGQAVTVYEDRDGWAFVQAARDGYVGYLPVDSLTAAPAPTHRIVARSTHAYAAADLKSPDLTSLSFGSEVAVLREANRFAETGQGHIPVQHLWPLDRRAGDPVAVAEGFLGTPYLWGGNSGFGIDCSGLVQAACLLCGIPCPGDSDQQARMPGLDLDGNTALQRNDLLFWKGHVAWVRDPDTILHANAHHMAVRAEDLRTALARIAAQGGGDVTARKRLEAFR